MLQQSISILQLPQTKPDLTIVGLAEYTLPFLKLKQVKIGKQPGIPANARVSQRIIFDRLFSQLHSLCLH